MVKDLADSQATNSSMHRAILVDGRLLPGLQLKGIMHKKTFCGSFNVHLACEYDAEKIDESISLNCLKMCILLNLKQNTMFP